MKTTEERMRAHAEWKRGRNLACILPPRVAIEHEQPATTEELRALRIKLDLSYTAMGRVLHRDQCTIRNWELGIRPCAMSLRQMTYRLRNVIALHERNAPQ